MMNRRREPNCGDLKAIVARQQQEIDGLRAQIAGLESPDITVLRQQVVDLQRAKEETDKQMQALKGGVTLTQGLVFFLGMGLLAVLGEQLFDALKGFPHQLKDDERRRIVDVAGEFAGQIINAVRDMDVISQEAWEELRASVEVRVDTLPPLKRALFQSLRELARPSKIGSRLFDSLAQYAQSSNIAIDTNDVQKLIGIGELLDEASNLWPLMAANSLSHMMRYVGFDDAAEAAGEILDSLEQGLAVPRHLVHRVKPDLVKLGAIEERTKPTTIIEHLTAGFQLKQLGLSPDQASNQELIYSSPMQLKRANRTFKALEALYDRTSECSNPDMGYLDMMAQLWRNAAGYAETPEQDKLAS